MKFVEFTNKTVNKLDNKLFSEISKLIIGKYVFFSVVKKENINREILSEKISDYIEKLELKTGKLFNKHLKNYTDVMGSLVKNHLVNESRAKLYYDLACSKIDSKSLEMEQLVDYTRIILCLYSQIIKNKHKDISEFDLSLKDINIDSVLSSMKSEKTSEFDVGFAKWGTKSKFNTEELYCFDTFIFMLVIILYYHLKNIEVKGE